MYEEVSNPSLGDTPAVIDVELQGERSSSYINTDIDSVFEVEKAYQGRIRVHGQISRFYWSTDSSASNRVSVHSKRRIVHPDALRTNVEKLLKETNQREVAEDAHRLLLLLGMRLRSEGGILGRRRLADAFFLFETLALLRATKLHAPADWSAFMAALSSDRLVRQNREPWTRYTKAFCGVYNSEPECSGFNREH